MAKLRVGVIYGGRSGEHEVSIASCASILKSLDPDKYEAEPVKIEKDGRWTLPDRAPTTISAADVIEGARASVARPIGAAHEALMPAHPGGDTLITIDRAAPAGQQLTSSLALDVVFPVLYGPHGEDGTVQGLLELAIVPMSVRA